MPTVGGGGTVSGSSGGGIIDTLKTSGPPLGKYQGFIYLGLSLVAISLSSTAFAPAIVAVLALAITMEAIYAVGSKAEDKVKSVFDLV